MLIVSISAIVTLIITLLANAQQQDVSRDQQIKDLKQEVEALHRQVDSLKVVPGAENQDRADELDNLEERLEKRLSELENKIDAISRASAPTVLNPRTTAFINFAARSDDKSVLDASGQNPIDNRAFIRTVELELRAPVDPYAEAITVISVENEAGKDFGIDAEEAYGLIKRLPILEGAPLGMKLKVGKFRPSIGTNNKIHLHDLPWTTRPLAVTRYLGTEHGEFFEGGFSLVGLDVDFFLPNPIPSTTLEMNLDLVRGGDIGLAQGRGGTQPAYVGHVNLSGDWNNEHLVNVGASMYQENGINSTRLVTADLTYKWAPSEQRESRSFVAGGEMFFGRHSYEDTSAHSQLTSMPMGWFVYTQYQLSWWLYAGLRYDWIEEPFDDNIKTSSIAGYLSYYTTEFLRFRLGYEHHKSDVATLDNINSAIFEVNLVFGSHPTEPYWVNR